MASGMLGDRPDAPSDAGPGQGLMPVAEKQMLGLDAVLVPARDIILNCRDGLLPEGNNSGLAAFSGECDSGRHIKADITDAQISEFLNSSAAVIHELE